MRVRIGFSVISNEQHEHRPPRSKSARPLNDTPASVSGGTGMPSELRVSVSAPEHDVPR